MTTKKPASQTQSLTVPAKQIEQRIYVVRDQNVMLDSDLAELYGVATKVFNQAVKRNAARFPEDFRFQLTTGEDESLRSQNATSNAKRGGRRYLPYVFTEQGVAMLSSVLNSERAIEVNIAIMRAFVNMRRMSSSYEDLARKVGALEKKYDKQFAVVFQAIKALMEPPALPPHRKIGFKV